jgi:Putative MetA-pathway of phenol degradation
VRVHIQSHVLPITVRKSIRICVLLLLASLFADARCARPSDGSITANPNRPTVADPADITQIGVIETEFGWSRTWHQQGVRETNVANLLKYAMLCDLEIRWNSTIVTGQSTSVASQYGVGDNLIGAQWRIVHQSRSFPTLAVSYAAKIPTASLSKGLGTGKTDHAFKFLASKDFGGFHFDFNTAYILAGRPQSDGHDHDFLVTLSAAHKLRGRLGITSEIYGFSRLNQDVAGYTSNLWALTFAATPRLIFDSGIDVGLSSGAPHKTVFAGFTYSIVDLNAKILRPERRSTNSK